MSVILYPIDECSMDAREESATTLTSVKIIISAGAGARR